MGSVRDGMLKHNVCELGMGPVRGTSQHIKRTVPVLERRSWHVKLGAFVPKAGLAKLLGPSIQLAKKVALIVFRRQA